MLRIGKAIVTVSLLLASGLINAQPYPITITEDFNNAWNTSTFPTGWVDSNLSHSTLAAGPYFRSGGHQLGGWALGPDSPATAGLHGAFNILPFDATDGFLYSRADSAMGIGPNFVYQYDSFTVIDNWVFLPVDSISQTTKIWYYTTTDPGLIVNNYLDSLNVYFNSTDTTMDTTKYRPFPNAFKAPQFPSPWIEVHDSLNATLVPTPKIGRIAFRHHVVGNVNGALSWFIGIDNVIINTWPVPVTLNNLSCKADKNNNVNVYWETESENNTDYFIVERSIDGRNFTQIGKVKAVGNSSTKHEYSYQDVTASTAGYNKVMYRLRQVDVNGHYGITPVVEATLTNTGVSNMVMPFLAGNTLKVRFVSGAAGDAEIVVLNANGQKVAEAKQQVAEGMNIADIDFGGMASGIYIVKVSNNKETLINRFVK